MATDSAGIKVKVLSSEDIEEFIQLIRVFEDVFEMKNFSLPDRKHLQGLLAKPDFIVLVAMSDDQVIGGLTGYVLSQYYSLQPLAYIYDLAVDTKYQRQGVGKKLIVEMNRYCSDMGFEEVFVQADKVDDYALDFYRSTPITDEEHVIHFYYSLNGPNN